jgi:hypothetical protein
MTSHYKNKTYPNLASSQFDKMGDNADKSYYRQKIEDSENQYFYTDFVLYKNDGRENWLSFVILNPETILTFEIREEENGLRTFAIDFEWDVIANNYYEKYSHDDYIDAMDALTGYMRGEDLFTSLDLGEILNHIDKFYQEMQKELEWSDVPREVPSEFLMSELDKKLDFSSQRWHHIDKNKSRIRLKDKLMQHSDELDSHIIEVVKNKI